MTDDKDTMASELIKRRGWSTRSIQDFLGEPDRSVVKHIPNRSFTINFFLDSRIEEAESDPEWQAQADGQKYDDRRAERTESRVNAMDRIRTYDIKVNHEDINRHILRGMVVESYNAHKTYQRSKDGLTPHIPVTVESLPSETLTRLLLNYIRHNFTNYDQAIKKLAVAKGEKEEYLALRARYFEALRKHFPDLAQALTEHENRSSERDYETYTKLR